MKNKLFILTTFLMTLLLVGCSSFNSYKELGDDQILIAGFDGKTTVYENIYSNNFEGNKVTNKINLIQLNLAVTTSKSTMDFYNKTEIYDEKTEDGVTKYYFLEFESIKDPILFTTYQEETIDNTKIEYNISEKLVKRTYTHNVNIIFEQDEYEYQYKNEIKNYDENTTINQALSNEYIEANFKNIYKQVLDIQNNNNEDGAITILYGMHYANTRSVHFYFTDHIKIKNKEKIGW